MIFFSICVLYNLYIYNIRIILLNFNQNFGLIKFNKFQEYVHQLQEYNFNKGVLTEFQGFARFFLVVLCND